MDIMSFFSILGESLYSVCLIGTGLLVVLGAIAMITKNEIVRKTTSSVAILLLVMWIGQIVLSVSYLFSSGGNV